MAKMNVTEPIQMLESDALTGGYMQTIATKYIGPSATKPARIVAQTSSGRKLTMSRWKAEEMAKAQDMESIHRFVAMTLANSLDWPGRWIAGDTKTGYVFVLDPHPF